MQTTGEHRSSIIDARPVILWAGLQLGAVLLGASEFPLWAHHPYPRTSLALDEQMAVEFLGSAMLCPILGTSRWTIAGILLVSMVSLEFAALLATQLQSTVLLLWVMVSLWKLGLFGWTRELSPERRMYLGCLATLFIGGAWIVRYLHVEMTASGGRQGAGEMAGALLPIGSGVLDGAGWLFAGVPLLSLAITRLTSYQKCASIRPSTCLH